MTKRIFRSICIVALSVFLSSIGLFMGVLYDYFSNVQRSQLEMQTNLAAQGAANEGMKYFEGLDVTDYRITWIDTDCTVLYDSKSDFAEMENHMEREEIRQALSEGTGESSRYSITLLERAVYCAHRLPDGTILRLSITRNTPLTLILGMMQPICMIFVAALGMSLVLAFRLAKGIVEPLNALNLDEPLSNDEYDELTPLLKRIAAQQCQIRKQGEELKQKQIEFDAVTTGMAEGIVLLNEKKIILSMNPAAMRLFGAARSCVGKYLFSVNRSLELQELLQKASDGKRAEMLMEFGDGTYQLDVSPVLSENLVSGIVLLMLDVTEKEKAERMRREFTANVSHELKTPLHTISGSAELIAGGMVKQGDIPEFSKRIYAEAQRLIHLVEDIIRLSHLDEGVDGMKWEEIDLSLVAGETVQTLLPEAETAGIQINFCGETAIVYGVRQLLQSIVFNLCDNAVKYNHKGGSVSVSVKGEKNNVILSVADTGIGILAEHQERIFERFYRVDKSHSKEIGGTGLGLSIVKHAAKLHDAEIELYSAAKEGTTIKVSFPVYKNFTKL